MFLISDPSNEMAMQLVLLVCQWRFIVVHLKRCRRAVPCFPALFRDPFCVLVVGGLSLRAVRGLSAEETKIAKVRRHGKRKGEHGGKDNTEERVREDDEGEG